MKVYYGFSKLTAKMVRKPEIAIYFENSDWWNNRAWVEKRMEIIHERDQTKGEGEDGKFSNRRFTKYRYFVFDKPYNGDLEAALVANYEADSKNVGEAERKQIMGKLRAGFYSFYRIPRPKATGQLKLNLFNID